MNAGYPANLISDPSGVVTLMMFDNLNTKFNGESSEIIAIVILYVQDILTHYL